MNYQIQKIEAEPDNGPSDYIANLDALLRMGIYFTGELERLGSRASSHAQYAVDVIELELDLRKHIAVNQAAKKVLNTPLLTPSH